MRAVRNTTMNNLFMVIVINMTIAFVSVTALTAVTITSRTTTSSTTTATAATSILSPHYRFHTGPHRPLLQHLQRRSFRMHQQQQQQQQNNDNEPEVIPSSLQSPPDVVSSFNVTDEHPTMMNADVNKSKATSTATSSSMSNTSNSNDHIQYIGTMANEIQQFTFLAAFVALGLGTQVCIQAWYTGGIALLGPQYFYTIQTQIFPIVFGSIFAIVGVCHFRFVDNFARIVPPYNGWGGLWKVPAPFHTQMNITYEEYHSYWTGIVEFLGGVWLLYTGIISSSSIIPATILFGLTIGVTPANLYMFTHNASPGGQIPSLQYPFGHLARFMVQCGLLSNFYIMMHPIQI
jgi:uncharacterized membrane protein